MDKERLRSILSTEYNAAERREVLLDVFGARGGLRQTPKLISVSSDKGETRVILNPDYAIGFQTS